MQSKPANLLRAIYIVLALLFTALAIYGSLVPFHYKPTNFAHAWQAFAEDLQRWSLGGSRVDMGVNILLFIPISFFWLQVGVGESTSRIRKLTALIVVVTGCMAVSLGIELGQTWFPPRVPSAGDVFAQVIGTSVGVMIWLTVGATISEWLLMHLTDRRPTQQIHWLLQAYALGLLIYSLMPLDLALSPQDIYRKYKRGRIALLPFTHNYGGILNLTYELTTSVLLFVPVGMLAADVLTPLNKSVRQFHTAMLIGFSIVLGIELAQLLVMTRFSDTTDLITGSVGVAVGIWIMRRWQSTSDETVFVDPATVPRPTRPTVASRWLLMAALYAVVLILLYWAPFDFTNDKQKIRDGLSVFFRVPLSVAVQGSRFGALTAMLRKVLLFIPLGVLFVMAARPLPTHFRRLLLGVLLFAGWCLALGIELGQIVLPNRAAVFDDVLLCTFGIIVGITTTSRIFSGTRRIDTQPSEGIHP